MGLSRNNTFKVFGEVIGLKNDKETSRSKRMEISSDERLRAVIIKKVDLLADCAHVEADPMSEDNVAKGKSAVEEEFLLEFQW